MDTTTIDLDHYRSHGARVFAGRDRGQLVRDKAQLDKLDSLSDSISVRVPEDVFSVNSSFFLGMFGKSVQRLGREKFRAKYKFTGKDISKTIADGIEEALRTASPLQ